MNLDMLSNFRECWEKIEEIGTLYAEAKSQSWQMQELRNSVLASIISKSREKTISRAEYEAKNSEDYKQHIRETAVAINKELRLKCEYEKWKAKFEAMRSLSSLEKAQINSESH